MHRKQDIDYRRVACGIDYIAAHFRDGPELADITAAAHLSPFHFQRLFTAWAGVSPSFRATQILSVPPLSSTKASMEHTHKKNWGS